MSKSEIAHTTKEANKYFAKLKYIVDNFEKLEKRMKKIEEKLTLMENIKELNRIPIYQWQKRLEEITEYKTLLYQTAKENGIKLKKEEWRMKYCLNCQQLVNPRKKFNTIVFFLLLCCTFFGGILYLIYYAAKSKNCPMCNSTNWGVKPPEPQYQFPIPQVQPIAEGFKFCVQCGEKIGNTVQFCVFCGAEQN